VGFNGAADFHRRKSKKTGRARKFHYRLQWGRRFSSAEIWLAGAAPLDGFWLQWGRRFSSAEIAGKPVFARNRYIASMGPPIFIGGNESTALGRTNDARSFNGAADFHRRKYDWHSKPLFCISSLQWGRRFSSAEMFAEVVKIQQIARFNGAADFHRRKYSHEKASADAETQLQWGRRFSSAEIARRNAMRTRQPSFNGAADFHRRKFLILMSINRN